MFMSIYKINNFFILLFLCIVYAIVNYLSSTLITEDMYYTSLGEQLSYDRIEKFISQQEKWSWLGYALIPVVFLIKFTLTAFCFNIGILISDYKVSFKKLFQITMYAEAIFLLPVIIKLLWFVFVQTDYTLECLQYFYPLSLLNLFEVGLSFSGEESI